MLLANPHLPWEDLYVWMEGNLTSPSLNVSGATLVGLPLPIIALNPAFTLFLALAFRQETLGARVMLGVAAALTGVVLVTIA